MMNVADIQTLLAGRDLPNGEPFVEGEWVWDDPVIVSGPLDRRLVLAPTLGTGRYGNVNLNYSREDISPESNVSLTHSGALTMAQAATLLSTFLGITVVAADFSEANQSAVLASQTVNYAIRADHPLLKGTVIVAVTIA